MDGLEFEEEVLDYEEGYEEVSWLWPGRIPNSRVTVLSGDSGVGKTRALTSIITIIFHREDFPDGETPGQEPGRVLFITTESTKEDLTRTFRQQELRPEFFPNIVILPYLKNGTSDRITFDIDKNLKELEIKIIQHRPIMIVFDPLVEFHSRREINSAAIRGLMVTLGNLAAKYSTAIIAVIHWNKNETLSNKNRTAGSHQYSAAVRSIITMYKDSKDPGLRIFHQEKMSLAAEPTDLAIRIAVESGEVIWENPKKSDNTPTKVREAEEWLLRNLKGDGPLPIQECYKRSGFNPRTMRRARANLGNQIYTSEVFVAYKSVTHWDVACERNLWGLGKISIQPPSA